MKRWSVARSARFWSVLMVATAVARINSLPVQAMELPRPQANLQATSFESELQSLIDEVKHLEKQSKKVQLEIWKLKLPKRIAFEELQHRAKQQQLQAEQQQFQAEQQQLQAEKQQRLTEQQQLQTEQQQHLAEQQQLQAEQHQIDAERRQLPVEAHQYLLLARQWAAEATRSKNKAQQYLEAAKYWKNESQLLNQAAKEALSEAKAFASQAAQSSTIAQQRLAEVQQRLAEVQQRLAEAQQHLAEAQQRPSEAQRWQIRAEQWQAEGSQWQSRKQQLQSEQEIQEDVLDGIKTVAAILFIALVLVLIRRTIIFAHRHQSLSTKWIIYLAPREWRSDLRDFHDQLFRSDRRRLACYFNLFMALLSMLKGACLIKMDDWLNPSSGSSPSIAGKDTVQPDEESSKE